MAGNTRNPTVPITAAERTALEAYRRRSVSFGDLSDVLEGVAIETRDFVSEKIDALAARLDVLESKRTMSFSGAHDPGRAYAPGEAVQRAGSLWVAVAPTKVGDVPGAHGCWREIGRCK